MSSYNIVHFISILVVQLVYVILFLAATAAIVMGIDCSFYSLTSVAVVSFDTVVVVTLTTSSDFHGIILNK